MKCPQRVGLTLVLMLVASATALAAAEPSHTLNGHKFMPSEIVSAPFAVSHFGTITGGGMAFNVKTPFIDLGGRQIGTLEGDVAFAALGFRYQQRFGNWFASQFGFRGGARMGVDEQSVLAQGVTGTYEMNLGGIARILQSRTFIMSGAVEFRQTNLVGLDPYGFVQHIVENGLGRDNDLVESGNSVSTTVGVLGGWAPIDWLGIHGHLDVGFGEYSGSDSDSQLGAGLAAGVDCKNLGLMPLGIQLVARSAAITASGSDLANQAWSYGVGFYYTGWEDFCIGFESTMNSFSRRDEGDDFSSFVGTFNLRYWP